MDLLTSDFDQSLNFVVRNGFKLHPHFYNCTGVDGFALGTRREYIGTYFFVVGCILLATDYVNIAHTVNNCVVSMATTAIYAYLCILLFAKSKHFRSESISKTQTQIFFQSVLICSFNAIAAYIYVYMQFFYSPPSVVLVGQLAWQCAHGSVCLIYITMNRTVRRGVIDLVVPRVIRDWARIGTTTITRPILSVVGADAKLTTRTGTSSGTVF